MTQKILAISDAFIPAEMMRNGLESLRDRGMETTVRHWDLNQTELQEANREIEEGGPEAVPLPANLLADVEDFQFLVTQFAPLTASVIESALGLKAISVLRGGVGNVAVESATKGSIPVFNTPGRNARAVAECTMGLILAEIKNIARGHAALMKGRWKRDYPNSASIPELMDKTVGLVGFGSIARIVAQFLQAFGCKIIAYDPLSVDSPDYVDLVPLEELLSRSDLVSLHARLSKESAGLIGRAQFQMMKANAVLINTARSGLIDETALITALKEKTIMGAALDVFEQEPLPAKHPLLELPNVTIVPHIAGSTIDAFAKSPVMAAEHLIRALNGEKELPIVNGLALSS